MSWWKLFSTGFPNPRLYLAITWRKYPYTCKDGTKIYRHFKDLK